MKKIICLSLLLLLLLLAAACTPVSAEGSPEKEPASTAQAAQGEKNEFSRPGDKVRIDEISGREDTTHDHKRPEKLPQELPTIGDIQDPGFIPTPEPVEPSTETE